MRILREEHHNWLSATWILFHRNYLPDVSAASSRRIFFGGGCVKRFLLALRAKLNLDGDIFFLMLLRKIRKKMSPSKEYFSGQRPAK